MRETTHAMIDAVHEVNQLLTAHLICIRARVDAIVARVETLLQVGSSSKMYKSNTPSTSDSAPRRTSRASQAADRQCPPRSSSRRRTHTIRSLVVGSVRQKSRRQKCIEKKLSRNERSITDIEDKRTSQVNLFIVVSEKLSCSSSEYHS